MTLPTDAAARKAVPLASGLLDYFPDALAAVARLSQVGNDQHNPGQPLHWARGKSGDEADALLRHLLDRGTVDVDGIRHSAKVAWRALALLQKELEQMEGAPLARGARAPQIAWESWVYSAQVGAHVHQSGFTDPQVITPAVGSAIGGPPHELGWFVGGAVGPGIAKPHAYDAHPIGPDAE